MTSVEEIATLGISDFEEREPMTKEEFRHILEVCDALWIHSGDPKDPHAELTAGDCSNGFADCLRALKYPNICEIMANHLVDNVLLTHLKYQGVPPSIDWVIGSNHAGVTLSFMVALLVDAKHDFPDKGEGKTQKWERHKILPAEAVLQVEELITTTATLNEVRQGIRKAHVYSIRFTPYSLVLLHRSSVYEFEAAPILYGFHFDIQKWKPEDCPLCKAGSKRLRPKTNWAELTAKR